MPAAVRALVLLHRTWQLRADRRHARAEPPTARRMHGIGEPRPWRLLWTCGLHGLPHHPGNWWRLHPADTSHRRNGRRHCRACRGIVVAPDERILLPDGDFGLRADGVLP